MPSLPLDRPQWYELKKDKKHQDKQKDFIDKPEVYDAWSTKRSYKPSNSKKTTLKLDRLRILSPIQVGGYIFPEGGILPAQIGGIPCISGSSIRGAFLHYLRQQWDSISPEEQVFWQSLMLPDRQGWQPRAIRFENIWLNSVTPFPLNPQQQWQLFDTKENKLGVQWQVNPQKPIRQPSEFLTLQVDISQTISNQQKKWLQDRLEEMLINQGIGRGTGTGFGRLSRTIPETKWEIKLTGMKPTVSSHSKEKEGKYRWSPQVLKANLRGLFHRLALSQLSKVDAQNLTDIIFGSLKNPALLKLTSYLYDDNFRDEFKVSPSNQQNQGRNIKYKNIPQSIVNATWLIKADCNSEFQPLIGQLLALASRIGGLGPGWRRPPHEMRKGTIYRGNQFTVTGPEQDENQTVMAAYQAAINTVRQLAQRYQLTLISPNPLPKGCIQSIWQGNYQTWRDIVHKVCSTDANNRNGQERPKWCGNCEDRPSGYAVREYDDKSLITVFDPAVEATLRAKGFTKILPT